MEQKLHEMLMDHEMAADLIPDITDQTSAETLLKQLETLEVEGSPGPTNVGTSHDVDSIEIWRMAAAYYQKAFSDGSQSFPYVTGAR